MTDHLNVWREKLAGVTEGPWFTIERLERDESGAPGCVEIGPFDPKEGRPRHSFYEDTIAEVWDGNHIATANAEQIVLGHRLSRILADETSVEGLAFIVATLNGAGCEGYEPACVPEHCQCRRIARAVLNHLAQLALGDG